MKTLYIATLLFLLSACSASVGKDFFPGDEPKGDDGPNSASFIDFDLF